MTTGSIPGTSESTTATTSSIFKPPVPLEMSVTLTVGAQNVFDNQPEGKPQRLGRRQSVQSLHAVQLQRGVLLLPHRLRMEMES